MGKKRQINTTQIYETSVRLDAAVMSGGTMMLQSGLMMCLQNYLQIAIPYWMRLQQIFILR